MSEMNVHSLKPSELKYLLALTESLHYKFKNFTSDGNFPTTVLFEDVDKQREVVGKVVTNYNWGEFYLWPKLRHENLVPLLQMMTFDDEMTIFLCPSIGKSLQVVIEEVSFVQHPKCFDRKKGYARDVLQGLEYLHQYAICLMNLSEKNVLISFTSDKAVITDFSCARYVGENTKVDICTLVTNPKPPEASVADTIDCLPLEIWACGVMFLQMFTRHVLPWCSLAVDLLDGLEIELLRRANNSPSLKVDAAESLKEFLRPFLKHDPEERISAEAAIASPYLNDSCNRLDEPAREFWKLWDDSQLIQDSRFMGDGAMTKMSGNQLPPCYSYLKSFPDTKSVEKLEPHPSCKECQQSQSESNNKRYIQRIEASPPNSKLSSVFRDASKRVTSDIEAQSSDFYDPSNIENSEIYGSKVISRNIEVKLNKEFIKEKCSKDRILGSRSFPKVPNKSTFQTYSAPNLKRTAPNIKVFLPSTPKNNTGTLYVEESIPSEECSHRIPGASSSIEVIAGINSEEFQKSLVLSSSDCKTHRIPCRYNEIPFSSNTADINSEHQIHQLGGFLHTVWDPEKARTSTESQISSLKGTNTLRQTNDNRMKLAEVWPHCFHNKTRHSPIADTAEDLTVQNCISDGKTTNSDGSVSKMAKGTTLSLYQGSAETSTRFPPSSVSIHAPCHSSWLTSAEDIARNVPHSISERSAAFIDKMATTLGPVSKEHTEASSRRLAELAATQDDVVDISLETPLFSEKWPKEGKWFEGKSQRKTKKKWIRALCPGSKGSKKSKKKQSEHNESLKEKYLSPM